MTPSELKRKHKELNSESHFFDYSSMRFFGDTMRNYGVRELEDVWVLYRKHPVKHGLNTVTFFDKVTFQRVHGDYYV